MTNLQIGDKAPYFQGINENGEAVSLGDFKGRKLILFFYPKDNTPGCTAEACSLRDSYTELRDKGFELLGISADDSTRHSKFKEKYNLPFPLIADTDLIMLKDYHVWGEKKFMGRVYDGINRTTFVLDENGLIERIFNKIKTSDHAEQILDSYKVQ
jgi:thioredoxin-dependent peroxiredoxin